jgi:hypothetical protein
MIVDEESLVNAIRDVGFGVRRSIYQSSETMTRSVVYNAIERAANYPLTLLARALVVFTRPVGAPAQSARSSLLSDYDDDDNNNNNNDNDVARELNVYVCVITMIDVVLLRYGISIRSGAIDQIENDARS